MNKSNSKIIHRNLALVSDFQTSCSSTPMLHISLMKMEWLRLKQELEAGNTSLGHKEPPRSPKASQNKVLKPLAQTSDPQSM